MQNQLEGSLVKSRQFLNTGGTAAPSCNLQAVGYTVLIRGIEKAKATPGGILLPDSVESKEATRTGVVVSIGEGKINDAGQLIPIGNVTAGDLVIIPRHAGYTINHDGQEYWAISPDGVLLRIIEGVVDRTQDAPAYRDEQGRINKELRKRNAGGESLIPD